MMSVFVLPLSRRYLIPLDFLSPSRSCSVPFFFHSPTLRKLLGSHYAFSHHWEAALSLSSLFYYWEDVSALSYRWEVILSLSAFSHPWESWYIIAPAATLRSRSVPFPSPLSFFVFFGKVCSWHGFRNCSNVYNQAEYAFVCFCGLFMSWLALLLLTWLSHLLYCLWSVRHALCVLLWHLHGLRLMRV